MLIVRPVGQVGHEVEDLLRRADDKHIAFGLDSGALPYRGRTVLPLGPWSATQSLVDHPRVWPYTGRTEES
jgi:hypothetical protein